MGLWLIFAIAMFILNGQGMVSITVVLIAIVIGFVGVVAFGNALDKTVRREGAKKAARHRYY